MCGEMAGDLRYTRLLTGMGLRAFSMQSNAIPAVKDRIRRSDAGELAVRVDELMRRLDSLEADALLERLTD